MIILLHLHFKFSQLWNKTDCNIIRKRAISLLILIKKSLLHVDIWKRFFDEEKGVTKMNFKTGVIEFFLVKLKAHSEHADFLSITKRYSRTVINGHGQWPIIQPIRDLLHAQKSASCLVIVVGSSPSFW